MEIIFRHFNSCIQIHKQALRLFVLAVALIVFAPNVKAQNTFDYTEYFFDTDPGIFNATSISVPATADSVSVSTTISTTGLSTGFHTLFVRSRTSDIKWSLYEGRRFYIKPSIVFAEYFIDADPGVGNGISVPVTSGEDSISASVAINIGALSGGTHWLFVRTRDNSGNYSLYEAKPFFVTTGTTINAAEYFIDTDPSIGNGTALSITSGIDSISFTGAITLPNNITGGLHNLFVRTRSQSGLWSLYEAKPFFITTAKLINAAEYFIDTDPGVGNATALSIPSAFDSVSFTGAISIPNNITGGTHYLFVRTRAQTGQWSLYEAKPFFINTAVVLNAAEYFIDTDPGIGNGTAIPITAAFDSITKNFSVIIPNNLSSGKHRLYVRARSLTGLWSLYEGRQFNIKQSIVAAEYFFDKEPGVGNGMSIPVTATLDSVSVTASVAANCLDSGYHYLFIRTKDSNGNWSLYEPDTLLINAHAPQIAAGGSDTICPGSNVLLTANTGTGCSYQWYLNNTIISGATSLSYTATTGGDYVLKMTINTSVFTSNIITITIGGNCGTYVWTGLGGNHNWTTATNWTPSVPPNACGSNVSIPAVANYPILNANVSIGNVSIADGATLDVGANTLTTCGNWTGGTTTNATVTGAGSVILIGNAAQTINGRTQFQTLHLNKTGGTIATIQTNSFVDVFTAVELENGILATGSGQLTFKSTSIAQSAVLDNFSTGYTGSITGTIFAERYYASPSANSYNQHFMGSPVSNADLLQFGAGGSSGAVTPTANCDETQLATGSAYGNVFSYNEANGSACSIAGWNVEASGNNATPSKGYSIAKTGSGTLTVTGNANLNSSYSQTGNNSNWNNATLQAHPMSSGWLMVSNPYLATLDFTGLPAQTGFTAQIKVWNTTGGFAGSYQDATVIAPFQAFFVRNTTSGNAYTINASRRTRAISTTFQMQPNQHQLSITAANNNTGLLDITTVAFNNDATDQFDADYDANKLSGSIGRHNLYTLNNGKWMSKNILHDIAQTSTVDVAMEPGVSGNFTFTFDGLNSFDPTSYITMEDKKLNTFYDVRTGNYNFTSAVNDNWERFVLHFTPAAEIATVNQNCNALGNISITQPGSANWQFTIYSLQLNANVATGVLNNSNPIMLSATAGVYEITLVDNNGYTVVKNITVSGVQPIAASFTVSNINAQTGDDIIFTSTTTNATTYNWDFGDGTTGQLPSPNHQYTTAGTYIVALTVTNADGCSSTSTETIVVTEKVVNTISVIGNQSAINIWSNENNVFVDFSQLKNVAAQIEFYNVLGQKLFETAYSKSTLYSRSFNNLEAAYVIVRVKNDNEIVVKKVFVGK